MTKFSFCAALAAIVVGGILVSIAPSQGVPNYNQPRNQGYSQYPPNQPNGQAPVQQASQQRMPAPVALLDVGHILEESSRIKAAKEALKAEMQQADGQLIQKQETIRKKQEQLRQFQPGSPDYKELEAEITQDISNLKVEATLKRKEFGERQSQFLYNAYKEIEQEVQSLAAEHGFVMVLRISRAEVPTENLEAVYAYAGKNVVWSDGRYDITNEILNRLERRAGYGANPNMGSSQNRPGIPMQPQRR